MSLFREFYGEAGVCLCILRFGKSTNVILDKNSTISRNSSVIHMIKCQAIQRSLSVRITADSGNSAYNDEIGFFATDGTQWIDNECAISFDWQMVQSLL